MKSTTSKVLPNSTPRNKAFVAKLAAMGLRCDWQIKHESFWLERWAHVNGRAIVAQFFSGADGYSYYLETPTELLEQGGIELHGYFNDYCGAVRTPNQTLRRCAPLDSHAMELKVLGTVTGSDRGI